VWRGKGKGAENEVQEEQEVVKRGWCLLSLKIAAQSVARRAMMSMSRQPDNHWHLPGGLPKLDPHPFGQKRQGFPPSTWVCTYIHISLGTLPPDRY
jgi:hypothetical protein